MLNHHHQQPPMWQKTMHTICSKTNLHLTGPTTILQSFSYLHEKSTRAWTSGLHQHWKLAKIHHYLGLQWRKCIRQWMPSKRETCLSRPFSSNMWVQFILIPQPGWWQHMNSVRGTLERFCTINLPQLILWIPLILGLTVNLIMQVIICGQTWCLEILHGMRWYVFNRSTVC